MIVRANVVSQGKLERKGFLGWACAVQPGFDAMSHLRRVEIMFGSSCVTYAYVIRCYCFTRASTDCEFRLRRGQDCGLVGSFDLAFIWKSPLAAGDVQGQSARK